MAATLALGASAFGRVGSSPTLGTTMYVCRQLTDEINKELGNPINFVL